MASQLQNILFRQQVITAVRHFFTDNNFQEIDLPILQSSIPDEQNIYPFRTKWQYSDKKLYLSTSPEAGLKHLITTQGLGDCFTIHHSFRDLEAKGPHHQPEFIMLEWYRLHSDQSQIISDIENLIKDIVNRTGIIKDIRTKKLLISPYPQISFHQLFQKYAPHHAIPDNEPDINQIFLNYIEPRLDAYQPLFITSFPDFMSPLAQPNPDGTSTRFEFYLGSTEIANGCTENLHPQIYVPWQNLPPSAGCGLGIDRLAMSLANLNSIEQILPLPL